MAKYFLILAVWSISVFGQNSATPLTNETIIRLVASGVPAETIINTIRGAGAVNFSFLPGDLDLFQRYHVPDDVVRAMSAKDNGKPIPNFTASAPVVAAKIIPPQVQPQPTPPPAITAPTRVAEPQVLTNDSLVKLVKAGMGEETVVGIVNSQPGQYSLSPDSLIGLKQAGVSDKIIAAMVNRNVGTRDQEPTQKSIAQSGQNLNFVSSAPPHIKESEPRVFLQSASKGTNRNAARDQSMEMSKDLEKNCPGVRITINQQAADYTVLLNHIEVGLIVRDNQIQVANRDGDLISKTKEGGSIAAGMKRACALVLEDWAKR